MMELDEAIKHCHEKAEELHDREIYTDTDGIECMDYECNQCAKEHEQLAEWLTDYKRLKALEEQERPAGDLIKAFELLKANCKNRECNKDCVFYRELRIGHYTEQYCGLCEIVLNDEEEKENG